MRPRRLDSESEELLEMMFFQVKIDMKVRSNQFQVASKLISNFQDEIRNENLSLEVNYLLDMDKQRMVRLTSLAKYFGLPHYVFTHGHFGNLEGYLKRATPAAIVQMVKRIRFRYKTHELK